MFQDNNYITGDKVLNYVKLLNNPNIKYIKTDFIKKRQDPFLIKMTKWRGFNEIIDLRNVTIIITGHSDFPIDQKELTILNLPNLKLWICQNKNINHPKLLSIPIGITNYDEPNKKIHKIIGNTKRLYTISIQPKQILNLVYLNITCKNYPQERLNIVSRYKDKKWVTYETPNRTDNGHENFLKKIKDHKFIFAPRGNGIDTHRLWEALYLNTIPIVKKCIGMEDFYHLPILFVNDWDNITEVFLNKKYDEINSKKYDLSSITIDYWIKLLKKSSI